LIYIWFGLFGEILILAFIKPFIADFEVVAIIAVSLHIFFTMIVLMNWKNKFNEIFLGAFLARVLFMFWDIFASSIFTLPGSGADSVDFYYTAVNISQNISLLKGDIYGGIYVKIMGFFFYLIGPQQMMGQYINVLLGLSTIFIVYKILMMLRIKDEIINKIIIIAAFLPNSLILTSIFLREAFIIFFVAGSLYFFIKWFISGGYNNIFLSICLLLCASMFHSGVIGLAIGYCFCFLFYNKDKNSYGFTIRSILIFILLISAYLTLFIKYQDLFMGKFSKIESAEDVIGVMNFRRGGSAYLTSINISNPFLAIVFSPLFVFYFLTSPLPMNWRGFQDVLTFATDSIFYLGVILYFVRNKKWFGYRWKIILSLLIVLLGVLFIFGISIANAGTAMRHRQKIISVFLVLLAVMMDGKKHTLLTVKKQMRTRQVQD
jgi:hypothetical protein